MYSSEEGCDRNSSTPKKDNKEQHEEDSDANDSLGSFSSADDDISFSSESTSVNTQEEMDDMKQIDLLNNIDGSFVNDQEY